MRRVVIATLRGNLRRLVGTSFAVCLGVAFLAGTLVLSDTLRANFDSLFEQALGRTDFLGFLGGFLLVFAVVALVVATFSIYNTFCILVAQRSREAALLRAIGAS